MSEPEKSTGPILETTDDAIRLGKTLLRTERSGTIATIDPDTGWPTATRVGVSTDADGTPVVLISRLAAHTRALLVDQRCSLLLGLPGKGDPLAHARISLACKAREIERGSEAEQRIGARYLSHQPKAALYAGLGDFRYFRLELSTASLNAGFGRAYALQGSELLTATTTELSESEPGAIAHMNADHAEAVDLYARHFGKAASGKWRLASIDAEGMVLASGDELKRVWFYEPIGTAAELRQTLVSMAKEARRAIE